LVFFLTHRLGKSQQVIRLESKVSGRGVRRRVRLRGYR